MTKETVSIVVPVHGELSFLEETLESIANQAKNDFNLECIVVFDRVPTEAQETYRLKYSSDYWRFLESTEPGIVPALNLGVIQAKGSLIARLDADDLMSSERIRIQAVCFEENQNLLLLGSQILEINAGGNPLRLRNYPVSNQEIIKFSSSASPFAHPAVMFRRDVFLEVGGYRDFYTLAEDYDLFLRFLERGAVENLPEVLTKYRVHSGQVSAQRKKAQLIAEVAAKEACRSRLKGASEPSMTHSSVVAWWSSFGLTKRGVAIKIALSVRTKFYTTNSSIIRMLVFSFLFFLNPKQCISILSNKFHLFKR